MILSLGLIFLVGLIMGGIFKKIGLPSLMGYIVAGILLGSSGFDVLSEELYLIASDLREIALIIIIVRAGLALNLGDLKANGHAAVLLSIVPAVMEAVFMSLIVYLIFPITYLEALLVGIVISAVSPAVIIPRMLELMSKGSKRIKLVSQMIMASCSVEDVLIIFLFTALLHAIKTNDSSVLSLVTLPIAVIIGIIVGSCLAYLINSIYVHFKSNKNIVVLLIFAFSLLMLSLEEQINNIIPFSALLAILTTGVRILYLNENLALKIGETFKNLWFAGELLLFVLVGVAVNFSYFTENFFIILGCIAFALIFRTIGVVLSLIKSNLNFKERLFTVFALTPKATVQAAIGGIPLAYGLAVGDLVLSFAVTSIIVTAPLGAFLIDFSAKRLLK